jgi:hypothetical protein
MKPLHPVVLRVCAASSLGLPLLAQAANLMPPIGLPDVPAITAAAGLQRNPAAAAGANATLVVFEDDRAGDRDIFAVRVDAQGQPLDAVPFAITKAAANQTVPRVVWNGQDWLCVYKSEYDPGSGYFATELRAQRVSAAGVVLDPVPVALANDATGLEFAVGSDGQGFVVAWTGQSGGNSDVRARRITAAGAALDGAGVIVQPASFQLFFDLQVAFAGNTWLFAWRENTARARRFTPALAPLDAAAVALPTELGCVRGSGIGTGSHFLGNWIRQTPQFTQEVVVQRFTANLTLLDAAPVALSNPQLTPGPTATSATWDGSQWIAAWLQPVADVRLCRFAANGTVLDPGGIAAPNQNTGFLYGLALGALPGGGALQLWHDARGGSADDVFATTLSASGGIGAERCLSLGAEALRLPRVTAGGLGYLVTAMAERAGGSRLLAWRTDRLGRSLDAAPLEFATAAHTQLQPGGAAWNGSHFLIAWADAQLGRVYGRRLDAAGGWLDAAPFQIQLGHSPDVGSAGGDFLVAALRYPSFPQTVLSYGVRVRGSDGAILDATPRLLGSSFARGVRVIELGGRWLVGTESHNGMLSAQGGISLHFVDLNGTVSSAGAMSVLNIQDWNSFDLASSGTSAIVVSQSGSNWTNTEILVQRLLPDGTQTGPMQVVTGAAPMGQSRPDVAWNGREYVVAYQTLQNHAWSYDLEPDVYALRLAEDGTPIDAVGFPLWNGQDHESRPQIEGLVDGRALAVAAVFDAALGAMRLQLRAQRPPGLFELGTGTPGCFGPHGIDGTIAPIAGASGFAVAVDRGPPSGLGVLALGTAGDPVGFDPGLGVLMHLDLQAPAQWVLLGMNVDATGRGTTAVPLPPQPVFHGFGLFAQGAFLWGGPCAPSPSGFSSSPGLEIRIQAP